MKRSATRTLATLCIVGAFATSGHAQDPPAESMRESMKATVAAMRDGGRMLLDWVHDRFVNELAGLDQPATRHTFDWSACPSIALDEARRLLGSAAGANLQERDGWGHPLEYCLRTEDPDTATYLVGVRSPGRDGRFDPGPYAPGGFDLSQPDHDVVWIDGFFVTWPAATR